MSARAGDVTTFAGRKQLLAVALDVAREAGKIIEKGFRHEIGRAHV